MSKNKKYIKYSIEDREKYYGNFPCVDTPRSRYAIGCVEVYRFGKLPKTVNMCNKDTARGMRNAYKILQRSRKIKF